VSEEGSSKITWYKTSYRTKEEIREGKTGGYMGSVLKVNKIQRAQSIDGCERAMRRKEKRIEAASQSEVTRREIYCHKTGENQISRATKGSSQERKGKKQSTKTGIARRRDLE